MSLKGLKMLRVLVVLLVFATSAIAAPPNFIVVMTDDQGYGDLGCYGSPDIRTPNLDRMEAEGTRFTSFYSSNPVCTPSRAGLLTGRYAARMRLERVLFPQDTIGIPTQETTIAEVLKAQGYATACIGKWHLGHLPEFLPTRHGFDHYFGIPYSNDMDSSLRGDPPIPLVREEATVEQPANQDTLTQRYTDDAIAFIREHKGGPFFVYLPHSMPHVPLHASDAFRGKSPRGLYGDVIEEIDAGMGRIVGTLRELGLAENTLVIYTSDNGPWLVKEKDGGSAGPLREGKGTVFEGGMRVPCIAWWPGKVPAGRVVEEPCMNIDLLPTLAALSGGTIPTAKALDGRDISGVLLGTGTRGDQKFFYLLGQRTMAHRDGDWKIVLAGGQPVRGKPIEGNLALYNLKEDPRETTDVAAAHPEIVARLQGQLSAFAADVESERAGKK